MGENTKIEWADHTWNPWIGCQKVSPGCDNCYAEALNSRFGGGNWGPGAERRRTKDWRKPYRWNTHDAGASVFPSMCDPFDNAVAMEWRRDFFWLVRETPNLVWLLLTKRIGNAAAMIEEIGFLPENAAIGGTMVNQLEYDRDRMKLAAIKDRWNPLITFGSFEPLLGPVILDKNAPDWIIVGGESGRNARPMELDWARSLKRQSADLGRVFNFKQVGGRTADKGGHLLDGAAYLDRPIASGRKDNV